MKNLLVLVLPIILLSGCEKEPVLEYSTYKKDLNAQNVEDNLKKFPLEILWHARLNSDPTENYSFNITSKVFLNGDDLAVFYDENKYHYLNRINGENLRNKKLSLAYSNSLNYHLQVGGIIASHKRIVAVDKFGNETLIYTVPDSVSIFSKNNLHGDDYYFLHFNYVKATSGLFKLNIINHSCELISYLDAEKLWGDGYVGLISVPVFFKINGEEFVLNNYSKGLEPFINYTTYTTCTRISDGAVMWEKDDLFAVDQNHLFVHKNDIILNGGNNICKVSMATGDKVWEILPESQGHYSPNDIDAYGGKILNDKLIFISNNKFKELDLNSGSIIYSGPAIIDDYQNTELVIANQFAYWVGSAEGKSYLFAIKISDHSIIVMAKSPYYSIDPYKSNAVFSDECLILDPDQNLGYISDGYFIYCMKLL